jgi:type I restriction enzyme S subunit
VTNERARRLEVRPLRAYAEVVLGRQRSPQHDRGPHMIPYLRAANVKDGELDLSDVKEMNFDPDEQRVFSLWPGDVLVTEGSGSLRAVGASAVWNGELPGTVCFQNTLLRLRPRPSTDARFLAWWCRAAFGSGLLASIATGANIFHVSAERVRGLPMTYLDLHRQRAIADFLDAETARIDALIAKKRRLESLLGERLSGVVEGLMRDLAARSGEKPLRFSAPRILVGIVITPAAWYADDGVPALRGVNVEAGRLDTTDLVRLSPEGHQLHRKSVLAGGDIVVVRTGQAGAACVVPPELEGWNCIDLLIIRRSHQLLPRYIEWVLNSDWTRKHVEKHSVGTIQSHFNVGSLKELPVPVPPTDVQREVVSFLAERSRVLDRAQRLLNRQIELLQQHRRALITAAVTGELDIAGNIAEEQS